MRTNQVKEKLKRGEPALGGWLSLPSVHSARIMARLGFDWLVVDMEHSAQNPDEILSVPGIDVAFVGPNDLHAQLGLTPSTEGAEPEFTDALERIKAAARKHHIATGIFSRNGEAAAERVRQGFQMITVTTDISSMIAAATQNLHIARG